jgi:hypothetical protein
MRGIGGLQHLHRLEGLRAGAMQDGVYRVAVHRLEAGAHRLRDWTASAHIEILHVAHGDGGDGSLQGARQFGSHGDGAEGRGMVQGVILVLGPQGAIEPAIWG